MRSKKIFAVLLSMTMVFSLVCASALAAEEDKVVPPLPVAPAGTEYSDLGGHWAKDAIERWSGYGVVQGDQNGAFRPDASMTAAELAAVFDDLLGYTAKADNTFDDLNNDAWYADAVLKCVAAGILQGDGDSHILAELPVTRERAAVLLARALNIRPDPKADLSAFADGGAAAKWSAGYIKALADSGIISGVSNGTLALADPINRASMISILDRAISDYITEGGEHTLESSGITIIRTQAGATLAGSAGDVLIAPGSAGGKVTLATGAKIDTLTVAAGVSITVPKGAVINTLTANGVAKIDNKGTVDTLNSNVSGVVFDGNKPSEINTKAGVEPPKDSKGNELKLTPSGGSVGGGGGGGSSGGDITESADVVAAPLHDQSGNIPKDADLVRDYTVNGTKSGNTNTVTISAKRLMKHSAGEEAGDGYWVGVGVPQDKGNTYACGFGAYDKSNTTFQDRPDSGYEKNGKMYDTFYFGMDRVRTTGYIAVKTANGTVSVYDLTFKVELAPEIENVKAWIVNDEESFALLPAAYLAEHKYTDNGCRESMPWLVVTYDSNVTGPVSYAVTKDGEALTPVPAGAPASTINKDCYQVWCIKKDEPRENTLGQVDPNGTYTVTVTKGGADLTAELPALKGYTVIFDKEESNYIWASRYVITPATTINVLPRPPLKEDFIFGGWYTEKNGEGTEFTAETPVTGDMTVYAKWTIDVFIYDSDYVTSYEEQVGIIFTFKATINGEVYKLDTVVSQEEADALETGMYTATVDTEGYATELVRADLTADDNRILTAAAATVSNGTISLYDTYTVKDGVITGEVTARVVVADDFKAFVVDKVGEGTEVNMDDVRYYIAQKRAYVILHADSPFAAVLIIDCVNER